MRFQVKEFVYIFLFNLDTSPFSQVIVLTRISSMMLHKSNKRDILVLLLIFGVKHLVFLT